MGNDELAAELHWQRRVVYCVERCGPTIAYLHNDCQPPIIHRDITSRNILLDADYRAFVSDFGVARFLKPDSSNWSAVAGTYGYIAPGMYINVFLFSKIKTHNDVPTSICVLWT